MSGRRREPDRVELGGVPATGTGLPATSRPPGAPAGDSGDRGDRKGPRKPFLSIWYRCCHVYGRLTRSTDGTRYTGACPRCGARVEATIGPGGTSRRLFEAR